MVNPRAALIGCGYFARNHAHAWNALDGVTLAAVCDRDAARAASFAREFGVARAFSDVGEMFRAGGFDFVDIVTQPASHRGLVETAAAQGVPVICQKPLAPSHEDGQAMVTACRDAGVPLLVHENFRWQAPMRAVKAAAGELGPLFWGRIRFRTDFDIYSRQPYLATDARFILYDLGVHLLDLARFFFGEAAQLACHTQKVNPAIRGEDVATVLLRMESGAVCVIEASYASHLERDLFPQTLVHLEGAHGSAALGPDYRLTVTDKRGAATREAPPRLWPWSAPPGHAIQDSVVALQADWLDCLRTGRVPETAGADNLRTLELVFGAYESAETGQPYRVRRIDD